MRSVDLALMLLMSAAACGRHATVPFVPDSLIEAAPARLNIVLYLSSCTPCGSLTFDEAADFVRVNRQSSRMLVVVNRNAGSAEALLRERIGGADGVTFRRDTDGRIARSAAVPSLPILVIQPFYRPRELATPANAVLEAGESIPPTVSIDPNADVRVYPSSWIGRFDVERLPPLPRAAGLRCGGEEIVWDVAVPKQTR